MKTIKQAILNLHIEQLSVPFMLINNKLVRFTNVVLNENSSGDDYFLVVKKSGKLLFLQFRVDHDCDGTFYSTYYKNIDNHLESEYSFGSIDTLDRSMFYHLYASGSI